jgi:hypothetical protein
MPPLILNLSISDPVDLSSYSPSSTAYSSNYRNSPTGGLATHRSLRFSPTVKFARSMDVEAVGEIENSSVVAQASENDPLVAENEPKKPFYRARPLW